MRLLYRKNAGVPIKELVKADRLLKASVYRYLHAGDPSY
jgi:hypothetical protein